MKVHGVLDALERCRESTLKDATPADIAAHKAERIAALKEDRERLAKRIEAINAELEEWASL